MSHGLTLADKIWQIHLIAEQTATAPAVLYIDLQLLHEVTSPQAFAILQARGLTVRNPEQTLATIDHCAPSLPQQSDGSWPFVDDQAEDQVKALESNCKRHGITVYSLGHQRNGIVHVIGPELGLTKPGKTMACGDSHASTHGAFGTLSFGIGTTEVAHILATQALLIRKPKNMGIYIEGPLNPQVRAKDVILHIINKLGVEAGKGYIIEYYGPTVTAMSMEERMTLCNMSIEAGARTSLIAPDEKTFTYLKNRPFAPKGDQWREALACWSQLYTDQDARYDQLHKFDARMIEPRITYGTNPSMSVPVRNQVPSEGVTEQTQKALNYMKTQPGEFLLGKKVDLVFIGSCTNGRISDIRDVANIFRHHKVARGCKVLVVPGSQQVKRQAEEEGLDVIIRKAGAQWREPSCSMCNAINGDQLLPGELAVSTSNRNFEGRQGIGGRTMLASPLTAAITAVRGMITDPRDFQ